MLLVHHITWFTFHCDLTYMTRSTALLVMSDLCPDLACPVLLYTASVANVNKLLAPTWCKEQVEGTCCRVTVSLLVLQLPCSLSQSNIQTSFCFCKESAAPCFSSGIEFWTCFVQETGGGHLPCTASLLAQLVPCGLSEVDSQIVSLQFVPQLLWACLHYPCASTLHNATVQLMRLGWQEDYTVMLRHTSAHGYRCCVTHSWCVPL